MPGKHASLVAALVAAQADAEAVSKDSRNKFHGYDYASAEAIIIESRLALNQNGLATIVEAWSTRPLTPEERLDFDRIRTGDHKKDKEPCSILVVEFVTLHDGSDAKLPGRAEYYVIPEAGRPADKAEATALTYAHGYYLRGLLNLPRVDKGHDVDQRDDRPRSNGKQEPNPAAADSEYTAAAKALNAATTKDQVEAIVAQARNRVMPAEVRARIDRHAEAKTYELEAKAEHAGQEAGPGESDEVFDKALAAYVEADSLDRIEQIAGRVKDKRRKWSPAQLEKLRAAHKAAQQRCAKPAETPAGGSLANNSAKDAAPPDGKQPATESQVLRDGKAAMPEYDRVKQLRQTALNTIEESQSVKRIESLMTAIRGHGVFDDDTKTELLALCEVRRGQIESQQHEAVA